MDRHKQHWGLPQWVAYLREKDIPIMPRSKTAIEALDCDAVSPRDLAELVVRDPFLSLRVLRLAELRRSTTLGHETTTILGAVQQIGVRGLLDSAADSPLCDDANAGLAACEARAVMSASIALSWAAHRADVAPEELALAALLGEIGELMLWAFAPELPERALDALRSGRVPRSALAQQMLYGFTFKQLTLGLIEAWELPRLIAQLVKGADTPRTNIARIASDAARHILANPRNPALPTDVISIRVYLPGVPWEALVSALPIDEDYRESVISVVTGSGEDVPCL